MKTNSILLKYAVVELSNGTASVHEAPVGNMGCWKSLAQEASDVWYGDPDAVMLTTGVLTGTGVLGSGSMTWVTKCAEEYQALHSAGRMGSALRSSGLNAVIFTGKSNVPLLITFNDNCIGVTESGRVRYEELLLKRPDGTAHIAVVSKRAVIEEKYFEICGGRVSSSLYNKGIRALMVSGSNAIPIVDGERFLGSLIASGKLLAEGKNIEGSWDRPAKYLMPFEVSGKRKNNLAGIGLLWGDIEKNSPLVFCATELISAAVGLNLSEKDMLGIMDNA